MQMIGQAECKWVGKSVQLLSRECSSTLLPICFVIAAITNEYFGRSDLELCEPDRAHPSDAYGKPEERVLPINCSQQASEVNRKGNYKHRRDQHGCGDDPSHQVVEQEENQAET